MGNISNPTPWTVWIGGNQPHAENFSLASTLLGSLSNRDMGFTWKIIYFNISQHLSTLQKTTPDVPILQAIDGWLRQHETLQGQGFSAGRVGILPAAVQQRQHGMGLRHQLLGINGFWGKIETGNLHDFHGKIDGFRLRFSPTNQSIEQKNHPLNMDKFGQTERSLTWIQKVDTDFHDYYDSPLEIRSLSTIKSWKKTHFESYTKYCDGGDPDKNESWFIPMFLMVNHDESCPKILTT